MNARDQIAAIAVAELGNADPSRYWLDVLDPPQAKPVDANKKPLAYCGAGALWCLRKAGLCDWKWEPWRGFLYRLDKHQVRTPKVGDIAYRDKPYRHHAVVIGVGPTTVDTCDFNGTGGKVTINTGTPREKWTTFYSVAALVGDDAPGGKPAATPAPAPKAPKPAPEPPAAGYCHAIDVSHHQDPAAVPWGELAANGVAACWVRAAYGTTPDSRAEAHVRRARAAGMQVGLYLFWRRRLTDQEQLDTLAAQHMACTVGPGDLAPWIDVEHDCDKHGNIIDRMAAGWRGRVDNMMGLATERFGAACLYAYESGLELLGWPACPLLVAHYRGDGEQRWPPLQIKPPATADVRGHQYGVGAGTSHRGIQMRTAPGALDRDWMRTPLLEIQPAPRVIVPPVVQLDDRQLSALAADALQRGIRP